MRGPAAYDKGHNYQVAGSDRGYVLSLEMTGPHTGDNDGHFWVLHAVEAGRTQLGFTRLMKDKSAFSVTCALDSILLELKHFGPDPLPVVRIHSDSDPSFLGELKAYCTKEGIPMTHTGGHRPEANGRVEKRIGLCTYSARGLLETATGVKNITRHSGEQRYSTQISVSMLHLSLMDAHLHTSSGQVLIATLTVNIRLGLRIKPVHRQSKL